MLLSHCFFFVFFFSSSHLVRTCVLLPELDHVMHQPTRAMRLATLALIPSREQPLHLYLQQPPQPKPLPPLEDRYHMGTVTAR
jgi:hypothetical protein